MLDKPQTILNKLAHDRPLVPHSGTASFDLLQKKAGFTVGNLTEGRGIMVLEAKLPGTQRTLEYRMGQEGLQILGRIFGQEQPPGAGPGSAKWQSLDQSVEQILRWQEVIDIADALRDFGTRTKGSSEDQKVVRDGLRLGFMEQVTKITSLLETRSDGLFFLRHMLGSKNENIVRLAVFLMPGPLQAAMQEDLLRIVRERRMSRDLRRLCRGMLYPEIREAYSSSRGGSDADPPSTLRFGQRARRAGEAQGGEEDDRVPPGGAIDE